MAAPMVEDTRNDFTPPNEMGWRLERAHFGGTMTPYLWDLYQPAIREGFRRGGEAYGLPFKSMQLVRINDHLYMQPEPLAGPKRPPKKAPPVIAFRVLSRLHPAFRARTRTAATALATAKWQTDIARWNNEQRPDQLGKNLSFQEPDLARLPDAALADHLQRLHDHVRQSIQLHFELAVAVFIPCGRLFSAAEAAGVSSTDIARSLRGSSPASTETARTLAPAVAALTEASSGMTVEQIRTLGPAASKAIDNYVEQFGQRVVARYDIDVPTLAEQPALIASAVTGLAEHHNDPSPTFQLDLVAFEDQDEAQRLLTDARAAHAVRDDNAGLTLMWPIGLLRLAVLEVARRLVALNALNELNDVYDLTPAEAIALLDDSLTSLSADQISKRRERRVRNIALGAPDTLGVELPPPPFDALPPALAEVTRAVVQMIDLAEGTNTGRPLHGIGIGVRVYRGRARVVTTPEEAFATLEPGEILVVVNTTPAYNAVVPVVGALVVEEGGPFCHAAIVATEFGTPALVGVSNATTMIPNGATIEVDPVAGRVTIL